MTVKMRLILNSPRLGFYNHRARVLAKKFRKLEGDKRYPVQWRNDYVLKKTKKFLKIMNVELEVIGYKNLGKAPAIITPNHSSALDPFLIIAALENKMFKESADELNKRMIFIAKKELEKNKKLRGYASLLETEFFDRKKPKEALKSFNKITEISKKDKKFQIIFPEGTRSKDGEIKTFLPGAFRNAKKAYLPIIPTTINNALEISNMKRTEKVKVQVIFHKPIKPIAIVSQETKNIAINVEKIVRKSFIKSIVKRSSKEDKI